MPEVTERDQTARRKLPRLHRVLLALAVLVVGAEIGVRVVDRVQGRDVGFFLPTENVYMNWFQTHPYMGFANRPGAKREGDLTKGGYVFSINSLGLRGPEVTIDKPEGVYRILCIGGSTTFSSGAHEDHKTYPARFEHHLNALAPEGVRYEVWNCGVNGYNTAENLIFLALQLVEYDADAIVIYHAANDARPIQARGFRPDYSHCRRAWVLTELSSTEKWLLRNVRLYAWAARGLDPEEQLRALTHPIFVEGFKELHQRSDEIVPGEGLDVFFRNLGHMAVIAREHGIRPVFCTFAACAGKNDEEERFVETVQAINERMIPFAAERDVPVLRISEALSEQCELFDDWMHFGDEGSDAHGRVAAEEAQRLGLFGL